MMEGKTAFEVLVINTKQNDRQEWLSLPASAATVQSLFDQLQIAATPQARKADYTISCTDKLPFPELDCAIGKGDSIDSLNWLAARLNQMDQSELATVQAAMSTGEYLCVSDVIDLTYNTEFYVLLPDVQNEMQLGHYYLYDSGMVDMPEQWKPAMDDWALGVTILAQEHGQFTPQGYLVKSGDEWEKHFGLAQIPEAQRVEPKKDPPHKKHHKSRDAER